MKSFHSPWISLGPAPSFWDGDVETSGEVALAKMKYAFSDGLGTRGGLLLLAQLRSQHTHCLAHVGARDGCCLHPGLSRESSSGSLTPKPTLPAPSVASSPGKVPGSNERKWHIEHAFLVCWMTCVLVCIEDLLDGERGLTQVNGRWTAFLTPLLMQQFHPY